jgi:hypothetical protein
VQTIRPPVLITEVGIRRIVSFCPYSSRFNETVPPQRQPRQKTLKKLTVRVVIAGSFLHTIKSFVSLWQDGFGRRHDVPVTGHDAVCGVRCEGFSGSNWTAPCLKSRIHRSCLLINFCRVNAVPSHPLGPLGEKAADRPDEGAFWFRPRSIHQTRVPQRLQARMAWT